MLLLWTRSVIKRFCNFPLCIHPARTMPHIGAYNTIIIYMLYIHTQTSYIGINTIWSICIDILYCINSSYLCAYTYILRSVRTLFGKNFEETTYMVRIYCVYHHMYGLIRRLVVTYYYIVLCEYIYNVVSCLVLCVVSVLLSSGIQSIR